MTKMELRGEVFPLRRAFCGFHTGMSVAREKLKRTKYKVYLVFWIIYWSVTAWYYFSHAGAVIGEPGEWMRPLKIVLFLAVTAVLILSIVFCFRRWGSQYKRRTPEGKEYKPRIKWYQFGLLILMDCFCFFVIEWINNHEMVYEIKPLYILMNLLGGLVMELILFFWFNSLRKTCITFLMFAITMSLIFCFVYDAKGEPLQLIDIFNFKTAWGVAGGYEFIFTRWVTVCLCLSLCLIGVMMHCPDRVLARKRPGKILMRVFALGVMIFGYYFYLYTSWNVELGIITDLWAPHDTYEEVGTNMGFFCVAKFMKNDPPAGYSVNAVREIAKESEEAYAAWDGAAGSDGITPVNIIAVMNESLADYRRIREDLQTNLPFMPYFDSLTENVIKGYTQVCIWGGGTSKTEYEFLTGNSVRQYPGVVPFVNFYTHDQYSLVSTLESQGYETVAIHPNKGSNWNRTTAYQYLGFDHFYTIDDFPEDAQKFRGMISDKASYEMVIDLVEQKEDPEDPLFIFDVTMQNHGGYSANNYGTDVVVKGYDEDAVNRYLSLLENTDEATEYLIEYFKTCEEPTMIIMFGDHYPSLSEDFETYLTGSVKEELDESLREMFYETPFFIWTNYESETQTDVITSCNFLGTLVLEKTGLEMTPFNHYIQMMNANEILAYNHLGYYDTEGAFHPWSEAPQEIIDKRTEYEYLQYNALTEKLNRVDWFFKIPEG